jgi:hypothetical protein
MPRRRAAALILAVAVVGGCGGDGEQAPERTTQIPGVEDRPLTGPPAERSPPAGRPESERDPDREPGTPRPPAGGGY